VCLSQLLLRIIRPHRSTTYIDAAYCYRPSSVVCRSVRHTSKPCKNCCTDRDAVWIQDLGRPKEPCIRWVSRSPMARDNCEGAKRRPTVKYRDTMQSSVQKQLNRSRCRLGCGLGWATGIMRGFRWAITSVV